MRLTMAFVQQYRDLLIGVMALLLACAVIGLLTAAPLI